MNVTFVTGNEELGQGVHLRGDEGGLGRPEGAPQRRRHAGEHLQRFPPAGVAALVEFLRNFENKG